MPRAIEGTRRKHFSVAQIKKDKRSKIYEKNQLKETKSKAHSMGENFMRKSKKLNEIKFMRKSS